ncbi:MAG: ATP-binding protein, partial [Bergeyella zoohelcum]|nr:ATP-binding protein [Bergeyella zoohelcum]
MNRLSLFTAFLMAMAIVGIVVLFDFSGQHITDKNFDIGLMLLATFFIFVVAYVGIEILFAYYAKKQIQKMVNELPKEIIDETEKMGFKELSEKISGYREKSDTELDMMKEMETFRKEYIGNISHELKTPLFSIQGYVEILKDGGVENLNIRDKYLERIGYSVERLIAIVTDLDMINRLDAGEIQLSITNFDINQLIHEVFDLLDLEAQKKEAVFKLITKSPKIFVSADKQKISQVLINLIANAIHYSNRKGVTISVSSTMINNKVFISVEDNGMGIKPELLPRIFERFYRIETSRNRRDGGSGLGLAIVKHILEAHGESISVKSEYLNGATFSFALRS